MGKVYGDMTGTEFDDDTPSQRIRFALEALEWWEKTPGFAIDMGVWLEWWEPSRPCVACLAGAARACKRGWVELDVDEENNIGDYETSLNLFRLGEVDRGLSVMGIDPLVIRGLKHQHSVTNYHYSSVKFKNDLAAVADYLESRGL